MYMCDLIVYMFREMCWGVVVFAGDRSLAYYYNIRHKDLHEILTFSGVLEEIKYTLDDEMLEEFITEIKNDSKD